MGRGGWGIRTLVITENIPAVGEALAADGSTKVARGSGGGGGPCRGRLAVREVGE